jgi:hypothetical protein
VVGMLDKQWRQFLAKLCNRRPGVRTAEKRGPRESATPRLKPGVSAHVCLKTKADRQEERYARFTAA